MTRMQQLVRRGTWCFDLLILTVFMVLLFGLFLGSRPLSTPDEARYSEIPREMLVLHDFVTPHLNGVKYFEKPPLVYWIQSASIKLFDPWLGKIDSSPSFAKSDKTLATKSISEWVVRIPNALIALLGGLFLYAAGRVIFDRKTGLLSAVILATSFLYFTLARMVTLDMSLSVFLSASLLAFLLAVNSQLGPKRRYLCYMAYVFAALAVLTKGLVGIIFPAMIVGLWILLTQQWRLLKQIYLPSGILLFLVIVLPWHILIQQRNPEFFQFYFIDQQFLRYSTLIAQRYRPDWFFIPILFTGFLPWIAFLFQAFNASLPKNWQQIREKSNQVFLLLWVSIIFIFFSLSHSKLIPYILPLFPAVALLTGHYLSGYSDRAGVKWGIILLPIIWLLLGGLGVLWLFVDPIADLPKPGMPFLVIGYSVFLLASLFAAVYCLRHRLGAAFILLTVGSAISFIIFAMGIPYVDTRSIKPLVQVLKPLLRSHDKVVSYSNYYQDLPFYLNQQVMTVNFAGELSFGMQHQEVRAWMLSATDFWQLWHSAQHVFVIIDKPLYLSFKEKNKPAYLIAATPHDVLLSNYPIQPQMLIQKAKQ